MISLPKEWSFHWKFYVWILSVLSIHIPGLFIMHLHDNCFPTIRIHLVTCLSCVLCLYVSFGLHILTHTKPGLAWWIFFYLHSTWGIHLSSKSWETAWSCCSFNDSNMDVICNLLQFLIAVQFIFFNTPEYILINDFISCNAIVKFHHEGYNKDSSSNLLKARQWENVWTVNSRSIESIMQVFFFITTCSVCYSPRSLLGLVR